MRYCGHLYACYIIMGSYYTYVTLGDFPDKHQPPSLLVVYMHIYIYTWQPNSCGTYIP